MPGNEALPPIDALLADGIAAFEKGDLSAARRHFAQAALRDPRSPRAAYWLGTTQYHLGNSAEARAHLEPLLHAASPPLAERPAAAHEALCRCLLLRDPQRALEVAEQGIAADPADPRIHLVAGNACFRLQRWAAALDHYDAARRAEDLRGGTAAFPAHPGQVPYAQSSALVQLQRWRDALGALDEALAREPRNATYHNRRGVILFHGLGDAAAAVLAARRAIAIDPETRETGGDGVYHANLATWLEKLGRFDEAKEAIERAIAISPSPKSQQIRAALLESARRHRPTAGPSAARLDFSRVGGMHGLKEQVRRIVDVVHTRRDEARRYGIVRNGILLYGPPGCGKTFFAEAMAGEFGLRFQRVALGSALTDHVGGAAERIEQVFAEAERNAPCLLFFDELDALAARRSQTGSLHEQQAVDALLQQIDAHRDTPGLVLVAATNRLDDLDPAAIREGRFDFKVKIYRPDFDARREILDVLLRDRPHDPSVDVSQLSQQMEGLSAAQIRHVVDAAAMAAMDAQAPISHGHLQGALRERLPEKRIAGKPLGWDDLILPDQVKRKLKFIERFLENPGLVEKLGVDPPSGALLFGPPGTGKTTIARVLACQTDAAFHAINAADVFCKWLGDSERRLKEIFEAARESPPAIVFIDEIEAILPRRGEADSGGARTANAVVATFLTELDGLQPTTRVFVIGATNRPELLDEAVLRPGRLSESIEIGLPDEAGRLALLRLHSAKMSLAPDVDFAALAAETDGSSGADLKGLCTGAGRNALLRELEAGGTSPAVTMADFRHALEEIFPGGSGRRTARRAAFELARAS